MDLSQVSRTAILTLICRAAAAEKRPAELDDPMAVLCLERLEAAVPVEDRRWIESRKRLFYGSQVHHAIAGARRSRTYDRLVNGFIAEHPGCTVVNLACGFDMRYWRIDHAHCRYIDLDLPGVIALKREALGERLDYETIAASALDSAWVDQVTAGGSTNFLLAAEGLFGYIPEAGVRQFCAMLGARFTRSRILLDIVPKAYTQWPWKQLFRLETHYTWGLDVEWVYGLDDPRVLETFGEGLKVTGVEKGSAGPVIIMNIHEQS